MLNPLKYFALFVLGGILPLAGFYLVIALAFGGGVYPIFGAGCVAAILGGMYFVMGLHRSSVGPSMPPAAPGIETEYETRRKFQTNAVVAAILGCMSALLYYGLSAQVLGTRFDASVVILWITLYLTLTADLFGWRYFVGAKLYQDRQAAYKQATQTPGLVVGIVEPPQPTKPPAAGSPVIKKLVTVGLITINIAGAAVCLWAVVAASHNTAVRQAEADAQYEAQWLRGKQKPIAGWRWYEDTKLGYKFPYPPAWGEPVVNAEKLTSQQVITITFTKQPSPTLVLSPKQDVQTASTKVFWDAYVSVDKSATFNPVLFSRARIATMISEATGTEKGFVTGVKSNVVMEHNKQITQAYYRYELNDFYRACYSYTRDRGLPKDYTEVANPGCNLAKMGNDVAYSLRWMPEVDRDYRRY